MEASPHNIRLVMIRENLARLPDYPLPPGYSMRWYRQGDEADWVAIQARADLYHAIDAAWFPREFGADRELLGQRQCYLLGPDGSAIGTATGWLDDHFEGRRHGRLHWVAVVPEFQGRGLGKALLSVVCRRMRDLGHARTYLTTSSARIPAIRLYLRFGFSPYLDTDADLAEWRMVSRQLSFPLRPAAHRRPPAEQGQG